MQQADRIAQRKKVPGPSSDINVTPLVDVVLVLLIIFMVLTPMMQKAHQVNLPAPADEVAKTVNPPKPSSQLILSVDKDKAIFLNQDAVDIGELPSKVTSLLGASKDKILFFRCDPAIDYQYAVNVMDICRGAGVSTIGIITEDLKKATDAVPEDAAAGTEPPA